MPKYPTPEYRGGKKAGAATSGLSKDAFLAPPAWAPTAPPPTLPPALAPLAPAAGGLPALGPVGIAVGVGIALGLWSSKGIKDFLAKQKDLKPYKSFSANPNSWDWTQTHLEDPVPWTKYVPGVAINPVYWDVFTCTSGPATRWENFFRTSCATLLTGTPGNALPIPDPYTGSGFSTLKINPSVPTRYMSVVRCQRKAGAPSPTPIALAPTYPYYDFPTRPAPWDTPEALPIKKPTIPGKAKPVKPGYAPAPAPGEMPAHPEPAPGKNPWPDTKPLNWPPKKHPLFAPGTPLPPRTAPNPGTKPKPPPAPVPELPPVVVMPPVVQPGPTTPPVPWQPPDVVVTPGTGGGSVTVRPPSGPVSNKPSPGKERKVHMRNAAAGMSIAGGYNGVLMAVNVFTEGLDFVDALWKGIPKKNRSRCAVHDYNCKLRDLWEVWDDDQYDVAAFFAAFINNQLQDYVFGRLGQAVGTATGRFGISTGLNKAINAPSDWWMEASEPGTPGPLPSIHYDEETGEWSVNYDLLGIGTPTVDTNG